jgi:hypothetical protein
MKKVALTLAVLFLCFSVVLAKGSDANVGLKGIPMKMNFEGTFKPGKVSVDFYITSAPVSTSRLPLGAPWTESLDTETEDGYVSYILGSKTALPESIFREDASQRYLEVVVEGDSTFVDMVSVPFAQSAAYAMHTAPSATTSTDELILTSDKPIKSRKGKIYLGDDTQILGTLKVGEHTITISTESGHNEIRFTAEPSDAYITAEDMPLVIRTTGTAAGHLTLQTDNGNIVLEPDLEDIYPDNWVDIKGDLDVDGSILSVTSVTVTNQIKANVIKPYNGDQLLLNDTLCIDTSYRGYLGIGMTNPQCAIHIQQESPAIRLINSGYDSWGIEVDIRGLRIENLDGYGMIISSYGCVGFPKDELWPIMPLNKLEVEGNAVIGDSYYGRYTAPVFGLLVQGNVGIGTTSPGAKLEVNGAIKITDGTQQNGYVLKCDANGLANWQEESLGDSCWDESGGNVYRETGNVGVGGIPANGCKLEVFGTMLSTQSAYLATASGNVGIGTTSPSEKFTVSIGTNTGNVVDFIGYLDSVRGRISIPDGDNFRIMSNNTNLQLFAHNEGSGITIKSDGDVGIGTTDPQGPLDVNGNYYINGKQLANYDSGSDTIRIGAVQSTYKVADIAFRPNDTEVMRLKGSGNVGIGTTSPTQKLHIAGNTRINSGDLLMWGASDTGFIQGSDGANSCLSFGTHGTPRIRIDEDGNVGIGTTSPGVKLHVAGPIRIDSGNVLYFGSSDTAFVQGYHGSTSYLSFGTHGTPRIRIDEDGNVGIGTTSPGSYKLYVNGNMYVNGDVTTDQNNYPDYVFEPGYKLMPMSELREFIASNKHLPGVPSADEVKKEGVKLFEQNRIVVEKVEEAYLYILSLEEKLSKLEAENKNLKSMMLKSEK